MTEEIFVSPAESARQYGFTEKVRGIIKEKYGDPKVFVITYGCQQNEADSERLLGIALECGYSRAEKAEDADLIIINTCAIREHAEKKALSGAGSFKKLKEARGDRVLAVCGCMPQQEYRADQIDKSYPYVDLVFGTDRGHLLAEMLYEVLISGKRRRFVSDLPHDRLGVIAEDMPVCRESSYKAWVSVMYGCNNFCTYCIVPSVRGRERSRDPERIIDEVKSLVSGGCRDITLLGQNVNSYSGGIGFPELLDKLARIDGDFRLRFMTSHPKDASDRLTDVMAAHPEKIARHFHLPAQSGSDRILKAMNRRYTREKYMGIVKKIREKLPDAAITTDIICGFPGETDADFEDTVSLIREVGFDMIYTFVYSPRPGTAAAEMPDQIPHEIKVSRFSRLADIQNGISAGINERCVGKTFRVLSDGDGTGRSSQNKIISYDKVLPAGVFADVKITEAQAYALKGTIILKGQEKA